jgi:hypothetical protein
LATYLVDLSAELMRQRLREALAVYVEAMQYPRGNEEQRASMWLEQHPPRGLQAVAALRTAEPLPAADRRRPGCWTPRRCSASPTAIAGRRISGGSSRCCTG